MGITYTNKGSATTTAIANAPLEVQTFWKLCDDENVSIARVRKLKNRYEFTSGDTFDTTHVGKVSLNVLKNHPHWNDILRIQAKLRKERQEEIARKKKRIVVELCYKKDETCYMCLESLKNKKVKQVKI